MARPQHWNRSGVEVLDTLGGWHFAICCRCSTTAALTIHYRPPAFLRRSVQEIVTSLLTDRQSPPVVEAQLLIAMLYIVPVVQPWQKHRDT